MNIKRVLITGGRAPVALELARLLAAEGITVHAADSFPAAFTKASNTVAKWHDLPSPRFAYAAFVDALESILINEGIELLIPTCEETFYVSKAKARLSKHAAVFVDDIDKLHTLHNKERFIQRLASNQIDVPKTWYVTSMAEWKKVTAQFPDSFRYVAKPVYSRFASRVWIGTKDLPQPNIQVSQEQPWIIQEYLEGPHLCSFSIAVNGKLMLHSTYPTEFTAGKGATVAFRHIAVPEIEQFVRRIVVLENYTGMISFDYIQTKTGILPIECNPRATSGLHLFQGVPIGKALQGHAEACLYPLPGTQRMLGLAMLLYGFPGHLSGTAWKNWLASIRSAEDVIYTRTDKAPFFHQFHAYWRFLRLAKEKGISALEATTWDIEWNGETNDNG